MQNNVYILILKAFCESIHGASIFPPAPTLDSKTGVQVTCQDKNVCSESSENFIYLMQNLRIGNGNCLTFFDSGANAHLIDQQLVEKEKLQLISSNSTSTRRRQKSYFVAFSLHLSRKFDTPYLVTNCSVKYS